MINLVEAELRKAVNRRGVRLVAGLALILIVWTSWSNHKTVAGSRDEAARAKEALADPNSREQSIREGPFGKYPYRGPDVTEEEYEESLGFSINFEAVHFPVSRAQLHPANSYMVVLGVLGTVPGVLLAVLLASTFVGAEFRWGYWKMAATNEPRRVRLIVAKGLALWFLIGISLSILLGLFYAINVPIAHFYDLAGAIPKTKFAAQQLLTLDLDIGHFLKLFGVAWLSMGTYATFAVAAVLWARATLAGPIASLGFLALDGSLTQNVISLRHASPSQQIAFLLDAQHYVGGDAVSPLWYEKMDKIVESSFGGPAKFQELSTIPHWRALIVLVAWMLLGVIIAIVAIRKRDLPA